MHPGQLRLLKPAEILGMSRSEFSGLLKTIGFQLVTWMKKNQEKKQRLVNACLKAVQLKVAIDSSVLLALGKLGYLKLASELFEKLFLAEAVFAEISGDEIAKDLSKLRDAGLVEVAKCSNTQLFYMLSSSLGKGEAETIVLALDLKTDAALLDDLRARKMARRLNVKVIGTLAVLKALLDADLIKEKPEDLCQRLMNQGFWVDAGLCLKILKTK